MPKPTPLITVTSKKVTNVELSKEKVEAIIRDWVIAHLGLNSAFPPVVHVNVYADEDGFLASAGINITEEI